MSRYSRAADLAKKVLGTDRGARNKELMQQMRMDRMLPGRAQNISEQVLRTPRPGGLVAAGQSMRNIAQSDAVGMGAGALLAGGGAMMLSQTDPNDLGRQMAQMDQPFFELMQKVQESASDLAEIPQVYFMQVRQAYNDEKQKQQELQNIKEFGTPEELIEVPPTIEEQAIRPVSVLMAGGGPAMSDNEPRFETRSPDNQMFSIENEISNLMKSYNMLVEAQEFGRAQEVANMIDQLQQQKIGIQAQRAPQQDEITRILDSISI